VATPKPLYTDRQIEPAYQLRYNWTGWPSGDGEFPEGLPGVVEGLRQVWEADGMRALEVRSSKNLTQALFSVRPEVSPILCTTRAKGRLQHALRREGRAVAFSRKLALRSVGENTRADVEQYIASQVGRAPVVERDLLQFSVADPSVDLSGPTETLSGRYWYNLHLVLVTQERYRVRNLERLGRIRDQSLRIAQKKGCAISRLAVMPDHLHAAMRGNIELSPQDIALAFQNNLAYALGQCRLWQDTYYVGTFGEYDMSAIRHCVEKEATHG